MTVCVASLAANGQAIVCIADKAISYGDYVQWDSDSIKMLQINPSGSIIMFSGGERDTSKVLARILAKPENIGVTVASTIKFLETEYKDAVDELTEQLHLSPRLLTRANYLSAISSQQVNSYIRSVADDIDKFEMDCGLLVCGFDQGQAPFILDVMHPGVVVDMTTTGFHAIGSGWDKATSNMLFSEHKRVHGVDRVLYDVFDAKAHAELEAHVGYEWDAQVIVVGSKKPTFVPKGIQELIEDVWSFYNASPFEVRETGKRRLLKDNELEIPSDWRKQLGAFATAVMKPAVELRVKRSASRKSKGRQ